MKCNYCNGVCIRKGFNKKVQKYKCKNCSKWQQVSYRNRKYTSAVDSQIVLLKCEGVSISSVSRLLNIPKTSVQRRIERIRIKVKAPVLSESGQIYEVDELYAPVDGKLCFIIYAINRSTKKVIDYAIGARTKENIGKVINKLLSLSPERIYTDKLPLFGYIIPRHIHRTFQYKTNRIERYNLTLRTHLRRLSRKTICYSKSMDMLEACFKLYIWGKPEQVRHLDI